MSDFEKSLSGNLFSTNIEKSFIDKILARGDIESIRSIIKKEDLKRKDFLELLYMLSSSEIKLVNFSPWDRYVILKFFVWIREFVKLAEILYDYQDDLKLKEDNAKKVAEKTKKPITFQLSKRTKKLIKNNERLLEHNIKFLVDLYLNIMRSSLSVGATGFLEILKNKFEVGYTQPQPQQMENRGSALSLKGKMGG